MTRVLFFAFAVLFPFLEGWAAEGTGKSITMAAGRVLMRVMGPEAAGCVKLATIPKKNGYDVYTYISTPESLNIAGSSTVAICRGTYDYLRSQDMGTDGWAGPRFDIPAEWPTVPLARNESPFKVRHCYNVVTAGYTFPYWTWERWERELDWLAMHGFDMIMAPVATEAIGTRVWKRLGLTEAEIDAYYAGPAHLPWNRMGNIRQVGGKLPEAWHRDQIALQHKLLARMRELGIKPVVQGFAGFVPPAIKRIRPGVVLHETHWNAGFPPSQRPVAIMPDDLLFKEITGLYLSEWQCEFGKAKFILVDSFNEMKLPETGKPATELLAGYGKNTYRAITAAIPDAVWTLQGWMFNYQRDIWNKDTVRALMESVPKGRLLVLDYANDYNPNWDDFDAFHGQPWIMGYVPNMGGKTAYTGKMDFYATQAAKTLANPKHGNLVGFTISGEGLENNEVLYELMSDTAWSRAPVNLDVWLPHYVRNRYHSADPVLAEAWQKLRRGVYSSFTPHPAFGWQRGNPSSKGSVYSGEDFVAAVRMFLSAAKAHRDNANYRDDALEMAALVLGLKAQDWFVAAGKAIEAGDANSARSSTERGIKLLLEADRLLESHSLLRLERWIAFARAHQGTPEEKDAYEADARQITTVWGPPVNDYSSRVWSGLIRDFYVPRIRRVLDARLGGKKFDRRAWEAEWVNSKGVSPEEPYPNPVLAAAEDVEKACAESPSRPSPALESPETIGTWSPDQVKTTWTTMEWDLPAEKMKSLKGVRFLYTKGHHMLRIQSAAIVADGKEIAIDRHPGSAGDRHIDNLYTFHLPENVQANNSCRLRAVVRTDGGTNSWGTVNLVETRESN